MSGHGGSRHKQPQSFEDCLHPGSSPHLPGVALQAQSSSFLGVLRHSGGEHCVPGKEKYPDMHAAMRIKTLL